MHEVVGENILKYFVSFSLLHLRSTRKPKFLPGLRRCMMWIMKNHTCSMQTVLTTRIIQKMKSNVGHPPLTKNHIRTSVLSSRLTFKLIGLFEQSLSLRNEQQHLWKNPPILHRSLCLNFKRVDAVFVHWWAHHCTHEIHVH